MEVILDSVVHLTEHRQLDSLTASLISTVRQFIAPIDVQILDTSLSDDGREEVILPEHLLNDAGGLKQSLACFTHCVSMRQIYCCRDTIPAQVAIPIILNNCIVKVLWVKITYLSDQNINLLNGFAKVYENFLGIVIECETDVLTGLLNRKAFEARLKLASETSHKNTELDSQRLSYWLCIFDIDKFKSINDTFGHLYGDEILLDLVTVMRNVFSENDEMFRFGGDEFVLLIAPDTKQRVRAKCERFCNELCEFHDDNIQVTLSMGMTEILPGEQASGLLEKADQALYYVKENGRNRIEIFEELVSQQLISLKKFEDDIEIF
ncbi:GGDEF domain-containing protein [Shewanella canadensis]|nr:GGDEF domain-containing protein [Shewanella canadensis]